MRFLSTRLQNTCFLVECMISNWKPNDSKVWKHFRYYIYLKPQNASLIQMQCKPKTAYRKLTSLNTYLFWSHFSLHKVFCTIMWNAHLSQNQIHCFPPAYYPSSWGLRLKSLLISWILWHQIIRDGKEVTHEQWGDVKEQHAFCWASSSQHRMEPKDTCQTESLQGERSLFVSLYETILVSNGILQTTYRFDSRRDSFPKIPCIIPKKIKLKIFLSNQMFATRRHQKVCSDAIINNLSALKYPFSVYWSRKSYSQADNVTAIIQTASFRTV